MTTAPLPRGRVRLLVIVVSAALLALSCGGSPTGTTDVVSGHDVVVVGRPAPPRADTPAEAPAPTIVSRNDLLNETRLSPDDVWVDPVNPKLVHVRFTAGVEPCVGVRLAVDAGPAIIRVVLHQGTPPEGVDVMCTAIAVTQEIRYELDQPVGSRELIWAEV